jgi:hypothetical protein
MADSNSLTLNQYIILLLLSIVIIGGMGFSLIYSTTPTSITNINITVTEKYPVHSYEEMCGKTMCHYSDLPKIIDNTGILYIIDTEDIWAKMEINHTYKVQYAKYPNDPKGKIIGLV